MKIFNLIQLKWDEFNTQVRSYLSKSLGESGQNFGPSQIYGLIMSVINGVTQNMMLYVEDSMNEQNIHNAERKKSVYSLSRLSGYEPSMGTAAKCNIKISPKPGISNENNNIVIQNHTKVLSKSNGLMYNIILPQNDIVININSDNSLKYVSVVEGVFEKQSFVSEGGELFSTNVSFNGDCDIDYLTVKVNGVLWIRRDSLYDMDANEESYIVKTSLTKGVDVYFGNGQYGKKIEPNDRIDIEYLIHSGEKGNINQNESQIFEFKDSLKNIIGDEIDGNKIFNVVIDSPDGVSSGTYSESIDQVRLMTGFNSRTLTLADPKNYKIFLNRFSFVGYNRVWTEPGSMIVNGICMKNYKNMMKNGLDYFSLNQSDFFLSDAQKKSIEQTIVSSNQQIGGIIFKYIEPTIKKYAIQLFVKMKDGVIYDVDTMNSKIRNIVGNFFADIKSDIFIAKSDIIYIIKKEIVDIDAIDIYILSEENEISIKQGFYIKQNYTYNPLTGVYDIYNEKITLFDGDDYHIGLDEHGNIYLENDMHFPVLMGGWSYVSKNSTSYLTETQEVMIDDPLIINFK